MIRIQSEHIKRAGKLLNRLRFTRAALPAFTHVLVQSDATGVVLAVANTAQWLETRLPASEPSGQFECFLVPPEAFKAALKADRGSVPPEEFVLPNAAAHVLGHPDFRERPATITIDGIDPDLSDEENHPRRVQIQSGNHLLITETVPGAYPAWRQVVPDGMVASATAAESRRSAVVSWLRSLRGRDGSVVLRCKRRGGMKFVHESGAGAKATIEVPADITGVPEPVSLDPAFLADALEIAPVLWITDSASPVVARRADGIFCVVMPKRMPAEPAAPADASEADFDDEADREPAPDPRREEDGGLRPENIRRFSAVA